MKPFNEKCMDLFSARLPPKGLKAFLKGANGPRRNGSKRLRLKEDPKESEAAPVKILCRILGFIFICIGMVALAYQAYLFGVHPAAWFILGAGLLLSDRLVESNRK